MIRTKQSRRLKCVFCTIFNAAVCGVCAPYNTITYIGCDTVGRRVSGRMTLRFTVITVRYLQYTFMYYSLKANRGRGEWLIFWKRDSNKIVPILLHTKNVAALVRKIYALESVRVKRTLLIWPVSMRSSDCSALNGKKTVSYVFIYFALKSRRFSGLDCVLVRRRNKKKKKNRHRLIFGSSSYMWIVKNR